MIRMVRVTRPGTSMLAKYLQYMKQYEISSRLWLWRGERRVKTVIRRKCGNDLVDHERYWVKKLKAKVGRGDYDYGHLVFHIHGKSCYDVWLPLDLMEIMNGLKISPRYVFWGSK